MDLESIKRDLVQKISVFKDPNFVFEEEAHTYHYEKTKYDSVTSYIKRFKVPFDREYWSKKKANERGVDVSVVLDEWQGKADGANDVINIFISTWLRHRTHHPWWRRVCIK